MEAIATEEYARKIAKILIEKGKKYVKASLEKDAARIREIAGDKAAKLQTVPHVQASFLITNCPDDFSAPLTDPVYLRPAVFVEPRIPRTL